MIFDLGMTLIRFIGDWDAAMERGKRSLTAYLLRNKYHIDPDKFMALFGERLVENQEDRLEDHVERPTSNLLKEVLAQCGYGQVSDEIITGGLEQFYAESEIYWVPVPNGLGMLNQLREERYRLGLVSNAGDKSNVCRLITKANLEGIFDPLLVSASEGIRKPDKRIFERVLEAWGLNGNQVMMIGDTLKEDIVGAQRAGIRHIWLKENVDTPENRALAEEVKPELIAEKLSEIPEIIRRLNSVSEAD